MSKYSNNPYANNRKYRHIIMGWVAMGCYCVSISGKDIHLFIPEQDRIAYLSVRDVVEVR